MPKTVQLLEYKQYAFSFNLNIKLHLECEDCAMSFYKYIKNIHAAQSRVPLILHQMPTCKMPLNIRNQKQNDWPNSTRHPWMQRKQSDHSSSDSDPSLWLKIRLSECSQAFIYAERRYEKISKKTWLLKSTTENKARCKLGMGQRSWYKSSFAVSKAHYKIYTPHSPHAAKDVTTITEQNVRSPKCFILLLTHATAATFVKIQSFSKCKQG